MAREPSDTFCIPRIETERLVLDAPRVADIAGYASIVCSERGRYVGGPMTEHDAAFDFGQMAAGWVLRGYGSLSIRPRDAETYLGTVLVHHEFGDPEPELGWLLVAGAEGKGYAREAAAAMKAWAWEHSGLTTLVSYMDPDNLRSRRLAEALGGVLEPGGPDGCVTYRYPAPS